jgi:hypothetical protein
MTDPSKSRGAGDETEGDINEKPDDKDDDGADCCNSLLLGVVGLCIKFKKFDILVLLLLLSLS